MSPVTPSGTVKESKSPVYPKYSTFSDELPMVENAVGPAVGSLEPKNIGKVGFSVGVCVEIVGA